MQSFKIFTVFLSILFLSACANKVQYGDAESIETINSEFGSTDLQQIAEKMVDSLLTSPSVIKLSVTSTPILFVEKIKNKTEEHIDSESVTDSIVNKLLRSGKFKFVDMNSVDKVKSQMGFQKNSGLVDQTTAVVIGKQVGAEYMLYGNLSSIVKKNKRNKDVYYKFTLKMVGLETGLLVWQDEKEIRKTVKRSLLGL